MSSLKIHVDHGVHRPAALRLRWRGLLRGRGGHVPHRHGQNPIAVTEEEKNNLPPSILGHDQCMEADHPRRGWSIALPRPQSGTLEASQLWHHQVRHVLHHQGLFPRPRVLAQERPLRRHLRCRFQCHRHAYRRAQGAATGAAGRIGGQSCGQILHCPMRAGHFRQGGPTGTVAGGHAHRAACRGRGGNPAAGV